MSVRRFGAVLSLACALAGFAPACTSTANVSDLYMSVDEDGARRRSLFFTDSTAITCIAEIGIGRRDLTVEMAIRQVREIPFGQGGDGFQPVNRVITAGNFRPQPSSGGPSVVSLPMVLPTAEPMAGAGAPTTNENAPFPPGSYRCEVTLDGKPDKEIAFNIQYPECPAAALVTGQPCAGFYAITPPTSCPKNGVSGDPEPRCTCADEKKGWECP